MKLPDAPLANDDPLDSDSGIWPRSEPRHEQLAGRTSSGLRGMVALQVHDDGTVTLEANTTLTRAELQVHITLALAALERAGGPV